VGAAANARRPGPVVRRPAYARDVRDETISEATLERLPDPPYLSDCDPGDESDPVAEAEQPPLAA